MFRVELAHLLVHALGIVGIAILNFLHLGLQSLHTRARGCGACHERHDDETHDECQDDDGDTPVTCPACKAFKHMHEKANKPIPHGSSEN